MFPLATFGLVGIVVVAGGDAHAHTAAVRLVLVGAQAARFLVAGDTNRAQPASELDAVQHWYLGH